MHPLPEKFYAFCVCFAGAVFYADADAAIVAVLCRVFAYGNFLSLPCPGSFGAEHHQRNQYGTGLCGMPVALPGCQAPLHKGRDVRSDFFRVRQRPMVGALGRSDHLAVGRSRSKTISL